MGCFKVRYDSRVAIYERKIFIRLATGVQPYSDPSINSEWSFCRNSPKCLRRSQHVVASRDDGSTMSICRCRRNVAICGNDKFNIIFLSLSFVIPSLYFLFYSLSLSFILSISFLLSLFHSFYLFPSLSHSLSFILSISFLLSHYLCLIVFSLPCFSLFVFVYFYLIFNFTLDLFLSFFISLSFLLALRLL